MDSEPISTDSARAIFVDSWQVYRKAVENDYLFHRGAYGVLHEILSGEVKPEFRFLDVACGDASMSAAALEGTNVGAYRGVDMSQMALDIAAANLAGLNCPVQLECGDYVEALRGTIDCADVVWIGLSLHHLQAAEKLETLRDIRRISGGTGMLLIYENTSREDESREAWLKRWDAQKRDWTAFSDLEWEHLTAHVHACDFPETDRTWHALGDAAGFGRVRQRYASPTDLFRLYSFQA